MTGRETQIKKTYRMLLAGATTNDFCEDRRLRNNWRARKTIIGHMLAPLGGRFIKTKLPKNDPDEADNYYYRIEMPSAGQMVMLPNGGTRLDPLGWLPGEDNSDIPF